MPSEAKRPGTISGFFPTQHVAAIRRFDELPIPFRAVATDIETGDEIVLSSGSLARAIRASMAVPGAFDGRGDGWQAPG